MTPIWLRTLKTLKRNMKLIIANEIWDLLLVMLPIAFTFSLSLYLQIVLVLKSLQFYGESRLAVSVQIFSHVLAYTNSFINPILYNCFSENFRKAFRKVSEVHYFFASSVCDKISSLLLLSWVLEHVCFIILGWSCYWMGLKIFFVSFFYEKW